jgi:hypothetical protein
MTAGLTGAMPGEAGCGFERKLRDHIVDDDRGRLRDAAESIAVRLFGEPTSRSRTELRFGRKGSLAVAVRGPKAGLWYDHEAGEGGDLIDLVRRETGLGFNGAILWCGTGSVRPTISRLPSRHSTSAMEVDDPHRRVERARRIFDSARGIEGTLAEAYLRNTRKLTIPADLPDDVLGFAPEVCWREHRAPALIALLRDVVTDRPCGIRFTLLTGDAQKLRAPVMLGRAKLAAVKLTPDCDVTGGLGVAEGAETALRVMATGFRPVWALGSAGSIRSFPPLKGIEVLTIFADHDRPDAKGRSGGVDAAHACAARWGRGWARSRHPHPVEARR